MEFSGVATDIGGDILSDIFGQVETVGFGLSLDYAKACGLVGLTHFDDEAGLETGEETIFDASEFVRFLVGGEDHLSSILQEVVEYLEEGVARSDFAGETLHVVEDEQLDALVEVHEAVDVFAGVGIHILAHEAVGGEVGDIHVGVVFLGFSSYGLNEVCFAYSWAAIDEERVEGGFAWCECHLLGHGDCHLVALADDVGIEGVGAVELRVDDEASHGDDFEGVVGGRVGDETAVHLAAWGFMWGK